LGKKGQSLRISIREVRADDERLLWRMLTYAASMDSPGDSSIPDAQADPTINAHVVGWGATGDTGVLAEDCDGKQVGAAWVRPGGAECSKYKLGDEKVPELAMAVVPEARGKGIGRALLRELLERCRHRYRAVVLSVREENPARRLYEHCGFSVTGRRTNRAGGASLVMQIELHG
jgi:GNAT superfamily N-acetyltransferase